MKHVSRKTWSELRKNYDSIIAWGTGSLFQMHFDWESMNINLLVDGVEKNQGKSINNKRVHKPEEIMEYCDGKLLIVIYTIYEMEILNKIEQLGIVVDTIIFNLIDVTKSNLSKMPVWNGKHADDIILLELIKRLKIKQMNYLDIGVCHPIMRNNTYMFYELGWRGVLVEPNPLFHSIISDYRMEDKLLPCGAGTTSDVLNYYGFHERLGFGTFDFETACTRKNAGFEYRLNKIPVIEINQLIEDNFEQYPSLLDIDTEGMDYELIRSLDTVRFPIEIIMCETSGDEMKFTQLFQLKGYTQYARVGENSIYYRKELNITGL